MIELKVMEFTIMSMVLNMKENGLKINKFYTIKL